MTPLDRPLTDVLTEKQPWEKSDLAETPNIPIAYVGAKKLPDGRWRLFFVGTRNEVFPGEFFRSASEARNFFKVQQVKAQAAT